MSKMAELYTEIEEQLINGANPSDVAKMFNVPLKVVYDVEDDIIAFSQREFGARDDQMD